MTTWRRCPNNECRHWYEKALGSCPECEAEPARHNSGLAKAALNNELYKQVEASEPKNEYKRLEKMYKADIKQTVAEM